MILIIGTILVGCGLLVWSSQHDRPLFPGLLGIALLVIALQEIVNS